MPSPPQFHRDALSIPPSTPLEGTPGRPASSRSDSLDDPAAARYAERLLEECGLSLRRIQRDGDVTEATAEAERPPALDWARSGAMALTGEANEAPRFAAGPLATAARGAARALSALSSSRILAGLDGAALLAERAALAGFTRAGRISAGGSARLLATRDGFLALNLPRPEDWALLPAWLESGAAPAQADTDTDTDAKAWQPLEALVARAPTRALVDRGRLMGLAVADAPRQIALERPGFRLTQATTRPATPHPRRLRLLDLSNLWAGPLTTSLLALAGIEVLKIESPHRPDGARRGPSTFFDLMNAGKSGCALDLAASTDRTHFRRLLDAADIVVESARPRGLEQLGFDAGEWTRARAGRLWVSITGHGRGVPERDWIAFGDDAAVAAGLAWAPGMTDDPDSPCFCADAIADPLTGLHAAALVLGHLQARRGGLLELSLVGITARAAGSGAGGALSLPIERDPSGAFGVIFENQWLPIAPPRARRLFGSAPRLAPPSQELLSKWTTAC